MKFATRALRTPPAAPAAYHPVSPPLHLSTTFHRAEDGGYAGDMVYSRADNPNRRALEQSLADLCGGQRAYAFGSGMAAIQAVFQSLATGAHVLIPDDVYYNVRLLLDKVYAPWGLTYAVVDMTDLASVERHLKEQPTELVWVESPSNPQLKVSDIAAIAKLAHRYGARLAVDNTWLTPVLCRPLELGADYVIHSTTKYFGGHSDVLGGALILAEDDGEDGVAGRFAAIQHLGGAVPAPFDAWLVSRGLRTLALRVRAQSTTALALARYLEAHPAIERVNYPGLSSHPAHELIQTQCEGGYGGMLSVLVRGGAAAARSVANTLKLFAQATSLGGVESLVEHRKSVEGPDSPTPENLLRLSVGLEDATDLIADWDAALVGIN